MTFRKTLAVAAAAAVLFGCTAFGAVSAAQEKPFSGDRFGPAAAGQASEPDFSYESEEAMLADMKRVAANARYELYYNPASMAIALRDVATGAVMTSNPYNASLDPLSAGDITNNLESQLVLTYVDKSNNKSDLWSSADCLAYGQYTIQERETGVRFNLTLGRDQSSRLLPGALTQERFDALTANLEGRALRRVRALYTLVSASDLDEATRKEKIAQFPLLEKQPLYLAADDLTDRDKNDLEEAFAAAGYTSEQMKEDSAAIGIQTQETTFPSFKVSVEYELGDDGLTVTLPRDSIDYDHSHYTLFSIKVLEFFGAQLPTGDSAAQQTPADEEPAEGEEAADAQPETGADEGADGQEDAPAGDAPQDGADQPGDGADQPNDGYLFIPDGSGALIDINNQPFNRRPVIAGTVYGHDAAITQTVNDREGEQYYLPVFGIRRNNGSALFAILEDGAEMGTITAKLGAPSSSYYTVYNTFTMAASEQVTITPKIQSLGSEQTIYVYDKNEYAGDMRVRYHLLTGDDADYVGMAKCYRAYLIASGMKEKAEANRVTPGIETIGTSLYGTSMLGINYDTDAKYTTYAQSRDIARYFRENGVDSMTLTLAGWRDKGLDAGLANKVRLSGALGGKKGFSALSSWAADSGVALYPETDLLFVSRDRSFDGFWKSADAGRMLNKKYAGTRTYWPDISAFGGISYAISPHKYADYWKGYFKGYAKLGVPSAGLSTMGESLNSNFNSKQAFNRGQTLDIVNAQLAGLAGDYRLSFNGANAYVLPHASVVKNLPLKNSGFAGETASVPFLQMAISGAVTAQSRPINLEEDTRIALLGCIESRTSPLFIFTADNTERMKNSRYTYYYAVDFEVLKEKALEQIRYVQTALESVEGQAIIDHRLVADGVACTVYADGTEIYVNYNAEAYSADGVSVEAYGYTVVK